MGDVHALLIGQLQASSGILGDVSQEIDVECGKRRLTGSGKRCTPLLSQMVLLSQEPDVGRCQSVSVGRWWSVPLTAVL